MPDAVGRSQNQFFERFCAFLDRVMKGQLLRADIGAPGQAAGTAVVAQFSLWGVRGGTMCGGKVIVPDFSYRGKLAEMRVCFLTCLTTSGASCVSAFLHWAWYECLNVHICLTAIILLAHRLADWLTSPISRQLANNVST